MCLMGGGLLYNYIPTKSFYERMTMTKADLINALAADTGLTKADADRFLKSFTATVQKTLQRGDSLTLIGFGTFSVSHRAARVGRNPQNPSQVIQIPASKGAKFKAGSKLKKSLN